MACPWDRKKWPNDSPMCECGRNRGGNCDGSILPVVAYSQGQMTAEALAYAAGVDAFMDGKDLQAAVLSVDPSMIEIVVTAYLSTEWGEQAARGDAGPADMTMVEIIAWAMGRADQAAQAGASIRAAAEAIARSVCGPEARPVGRVIYRRGPRHAA